MAAVLSLRVRVSQVEGAVDSFAILSAEQTASRELSESLSKGVDSPLSLWVFKLSKRLHIGRINRIRGTRGAKGSQSTEVCNDHRFPSLGYCSRCRVPLGGAGGPLASWSFESIVEMVPAKAAAVVEIRRCGGLVKCMFGLTNGEREKPPSLDA